MRTLDSFGIALGYFLLGIFCLNVAIEPGYACPIWPAAGWALVTVVYFGPRALPAVWLGALVLNLYVAGGLYLVYPFWVACTVTLQAGVAAWMSNRIRQRDRSLNHPWRVLTYLITAGPLACLISASLAIPVMMAVGPLVGHDFAENWFHWWIGDSLGVLALAPLGEVALLFLPQGKGRLLLFYSWPSLLTLALTALLFWQSERSDFSFMKERFQHEAQLGMQFIEQDLAQADGDLRTVRRFLLTLLVQSLAGTFDFLVLYSLIDHCVDGVEKRIEHRLGSVPRCDLGHEPHDAGIVQREAAP